jgi:Transposase DDE domain
MPTRIIAVLARLRQDLAAGLSPEAIRRACRDEGHRWRERQLGPVATVSLFLLQVLHGNTACQHVVHFAGWSATAGAYCQARKRLPLGVLHRLLEAVAGSVRDATTEAARWLGHRVWVVDGSSFSMPDTEALRAAFGQPGGQRPGCGSPVAKWLALFDVATGMLLRSSAAPLRSHEMARCAGLSDELAPGDLILGDRGFCSYAHIAMLAGRGLHAVFRAHQKQIVDFTPGRPKATCEWPWANPRRLPHSRWVRAHGPSDQLVVWSKPARGPTWMSADDFAGLAAEVAVRELRYRVEVPGYRTAEVTLVTTLLESAAYPAPELAGLYLRRWQVEVNFRHMKTTMNMDVLRCKTVEGVLKELAMFALAYNLVRSAMAESAGARGVAPERVSLVDAVRWLSGPDGDEAAAVLRINPSRPGRVEPRVVKRRPKRYSRMTKPRAELRKELLSKNF